MVEALKENLKIILIGESGWVKKSRENLDCSETG